jgi:ADP-ribose pyrophosphatase
VRRKPAVAIAPLTAQRKLVLIRQERIPIRATIWECPAGQIDELCDAGSFKAVALRELKEETGYELASDGQITLLGDFFSSPGFTDEHAFLVLASPVKPSVDGPQHQPSESIVECREFSFSQVRQLIARNEIRDANTLAIFARLTACELIPNE